MALARRVSADGDATPLAYPVALAGAIAAVWAAVGTAMGIVVLFVAGWVFSGDSAATASGAMFAGLSLWLLAHSVPVFADGMQVGLTPLLLTVAILWFSRRFMRWAIRSCVVHSRAGAVGLLSGFAGAYAVVALAISLLAGSAVTTNSSRVVVSAFVWALVGGGWGLRSALDVTGPTAPQSYAAAGSSSAATPVEQAPGRLLADAWRSLPELARAALATGVRVNLFAGLLGLLGLLLMAGVRFGEFTAIVTALTDSSIGQAELVLLTLLYVPTLAVWAAAVLLGASIAVGAGSSVALGGVALGPLPAIPMFALLPPSVPAWAPALSIVALLAVGLGAWPLTRRLREARPADQLAVGLLLAASSAVTSAVVVWLACGALGIGRFTTVGPAVGSTGAVVAVMAVAAYALPLLYWRWRGRAQAQPWQQP